MNIVVHEHFRICTRKRSSPGRRIVNCKSWKRKSSKGKKRQVARGDREEGTDIELEAINPILPFGIGGKRERERESMAE